MILATRYDFARLIDERGYKVGAELGVYQGFFSWWLLRASSLATLYSVDKWRKGGMRDMVADVRDVLGEFGERSVVVPSSTLGAAKTLPSLDFAYIDARHGYDNVVGEIAAYWPKINKGGCLAGHDYCVRHRGVMQAVNEFVEREGLVLGLTGEPHWKSWFVFKGE